MTEESSRNLVDQVPYPNLVEFVRLLPSLSSILESSGYWRQSERRRLEFLGEDSQEIWEEFWKIDPSPGPHQLWQFFHGSPGDVLRQVGREGRKDLLCYYLKHLSNQEVVSTQLDSPDDFRRPSRTQIRWAYVGAAEAHQGEILKYLLDYESVNNPSREFILGHLNDALCAAARKGDRDLLRLILIHRSKYFNPRSQRDEALDEALVQATRENRYQTVKFILRRRAIPDRSISETQLTRNQSTNQLISPETSPVIEHPARRTVSERPRSPQLAISEHRGEGTSPRNSPRNNSDNSTKGSPRKSSRSSPKNSPRNSPPLSKIVREALEEPFEIAARLGHLRLVELFYQHGARNLERGLEEAVEGYQEVIIDWLLEHGAKGGPRIIGQTGRLDLLKKVLRREGENETSIREIFHGAIRGNQVKIIQRYLGDPRVDHLQSLSLAIRLGRREIASLLFDHVLEQVKIIGSDYLELISRER